MAYKLDLGVKTVHGTNPQNLIEHIVRERIFASAYWKEECFGLNAAALAKRAMNLTYVGGTWGGARRPTPFLCLLLKMLMIQPDMDIVETFINERDFRYVRLLGIFYLRLVGSGEEIYKCLETLYSDNRKFKMRHLDGNFTVEYIDDFVDQLLVTTRVCDTTLPPLVLRKVLVERGKIGPRKSLLDDELKAMEELANKEIESPGSPRRSYTSPSRHSARSPSNSPVRRGRSPEVKRSSARSPSSSPTPSRSLSTQRAGFRSPSPSRTDSKPRGNASPDAPRSQRAERSPDVSRRGNRSPDASSRRSPTRSPSRDDDGSRRRANRSPDAPRSSRRADRSPSPTRHSRRDSPSPDRHRSRRDSPSPDRRRGGRSPDRYRRSDGRSPQRRDSYADDRDYRSSRDDRDDYNKKRSRSSYEDDKYDRYGSHSKRANYGASSSSSYGGRDSYSKSSASSKSGGGGSGGGGLREMSSDQMNELRKSIGLKPLTQ